MTADTCRNTRCTKTLMQSSTDCSPQFRHYTSRYLLQPVWRLELYIQAAKIFCAGPGTRNKWGTSEYAVSGYTCTLRNIQRSNQGVRTLRQQDISAAGHFGSREILPKCPDTSAALPMCLTDSSAVQPKCLVVCVINVVSSVDGRYAYVCLPCTFSKCIYSFPGVNICSCLS